MKDKYSDDFGSNFESNKTQFNIGLVSLLRLHELIQQCNDLSRLCVSYGYNYKYLKLWYTTILAMYREIRTKLKDSEKQIIQNKFNELKKIDSLFIKVNTETGRMHIINSENFMKYWNVLSCVETLLRDYADKKGMLVPNKDSGESAIFKI